ncbi:MAG: DUF1127 domain-containing protein [Pseudomonadota bacterium]
MDWSRIDWTRKMYAKTDTLTSSQARHDTRAKALGLFDAPKRLFSTWIWNADPSARTGKRLTLSWQSDVEYDLRAIEELKRLSAHELADIGLSRSDLTFEGLAIAGVKRAQRQDAIANEIARSPEQREAQNHGDQH